MPLKNELKDMKEVFSRLKNKDFSGNTGQAIKNSSYQLLANVIAKMGSLIFTIVLARIILPERFGLYSLALSTITIFTAFTGMGIGEAVVRFISKSLKNRQWSVLAIGLSLAVAQVVILIIQMYFLAWTID